MIDSAYKPTSAWRPALKIALTYAAFAGAWILLSDRLLLALVPDAGQLTWLQTAKGWLFVACTAALLAWLIHRNFVILQSEVDSCRWVQESFRALVDTIPHGIQESDCNGVITFTNAGYDRIFGYAPGEALGKSIWERHPADDDRQQLQAYLAELVDKQPDPTPFFARNLTLDGRQIDVQVDWDYLYDPDGKLLGFASIITDITKRKQAEEAILASDRLKSELINIAAHEFRTPLTTIQGFSELLLAQPILEEQERQEYTGYILAKAMALAEMVDNLLNLSRIEAGKPIPICFSRCRVEELVHEVEPLIRMMQKHHPVVVAVEEGAVAINADRGRIGQVLSNLLDNAAKYSAKGSSIRLQGRPVGGRYRFEIVDSGIGMTAVEQQKVFERFYRVDNSNTSPSGLGIGLSIVKYLVEVHQGEVSIDSTPGQGTTIAFELPLSE